MPLCYKTRRRFFGGGICCAHLISSRLVSSHLHCTGDCVFLRTEWHLISQHTADSKHERVNINKSEMLLFLISLIYFNTQLDKARFGDVWGNTEHCVGWNSPTIENTFSCLHFCGLNILWVESLYCILVLEPEGLSLEINGHRYKISHTLYFPF